MRVLFLAGLEGATLRLLGREAVGMDDGSARSHLRAWPPSGSDCRKVSQPWPPKPGSMTAPQRIRTLMQREVAAILDRPIRAQAAEVAQSCTHSMRPASSSTMISSLISL